jgi:DNA modification methylase
MNWKENLPKENIYFETDNGILYNAEAIETLSKFPEKVFDSIITDPPYGTTACKWDSIIPFDKMWEQLKRIRKDNTSIILFGSEPFSSLLRSSNIKEYKYDWYWKKHKPTNFFQLKRRPGKVIETISVFYKKQCKYNPQKFSVDYRVVNKTKAKHNSITAGEGKEIFEYKDDGTRFPLQVLEFKRVNERDVVHPTQKPVDLMEYLIKTYTDENDIILDFTSGSGSTLIAAEKLNRRWVGIELEKEYCKITKDRLTQLYAPINDF